MGACLRGRVRGGGPVEEEEEEEEVPATRVLARPETPGLL